MKKIFVSILNTGWIRAELTIPLIRWIATSDYPVMYESSNEQPIEHNRNKIVRRFLNTDCTHLLMIDNDNVPNQNPLSLINYEKDIISCPVPVAHDKYVYLNAFRKKEDYLEPISTEEKGLVEVDSVGTGIIMCSRQVLTTIKKPFERIYDENGIAILGLDLSFSNKAKLAGFEIYTHLDYLAKHYKSVNLSNFI